MAKEMIKRLPTSTLVPKADLIAKINEIIDHLNEISDPQKRRDLPDTPSPYDLSKHPSFPAKKRR